MRSLKRELSFLKVKYFEKNERDMQLIGKKIAMIFQDPMITRPYDEDWKTNYGVIIKTRKPQRSR